LFRRLISAAVLAPATFFVIWKGGLLFLAFVALCAAVSLYEWTQLSLKTDRRIFFSICGVAYILLTYWCCYLIGSGFAVTLPLLFVLMVWASDSGAYFVGKKIGGRKMSPEVSPNKTWSGFAGALLAPALVAWLFLFWHGGYAPPGLAHGIAALASGALLGFVGQSGDLVVSFLKRRAGAKDSGHLIPGHGGLLDRVDAMILAAPVYLFILTEFPDVFPG
jgi:phosphatidate cytidylyltransferase